MSAGRSNRKRRLSVAVDSRCPSATTSDPKDCDRWAESMDSDEGQSRIELTIPGLVEAVGPAVEHIMNRVREVGCVEGHEFEVEVALLEAMANAVEHGCRGDSTKEVSVWAVCCEQCGLLVVIRDPGLGFDPSRIPSPVEGDNLLRTHGRGVWLINRLMDDVRYDKQGTEIRMLKKANKKPESAE